MDTKACSLTEDEIKQLISYHGYNLHENNYDEHIERINYLNRRLKSFKEPEVKTEEVKTDSIPAVKDGW